MRVGGLAIEVARADSAVTALAGRRRTSAR